MIQVGVKFSSKPRNGYDYIYQIVGEKVKNTSFPEYDERSVARLQSKREIEERFASKDYIILKK